MFVYGTVTIVNSIIRDNTAGSGGGVFVDSATVNVYGTTFSSNSASSGPDIRNSDGMVNVYKFLFSRREQQRTVIIAR